MSVLQMPLPGEVVEAPDGTRLKRGPEMPLYTEEGCKGCYFDGQQPCRSKQMCGVIEEQQAYLFITEYEWERLEL